MKPEAPNAPRASLPSIRTTGRHRLDPGGRHQLETTGRLQSEQVVAIACARIPAQDRTKRIHYPVKKLLNRGDCLFLNT
jgi:hypothetical protein